MNTQDKLKLAKEVGLSVPHYTNTDNPVDFPKSSNKRIQELWENSDAIHTVYPRQGSPIYASSELLEKFAELIVRECAGVCDDERDSTDSEFGKLVAEGCALKIMERFGVEE